MSKVFFSVSVSLDGYLAPPGMDMEHAGDPTYEAWGAQWGKLQSWICSARRKPTAGAPIPEHPATPTPTSAVAPSPAFDIGAVIERVHFAFRREGDRWLAGHDTHSVVATPRSFSVTPLSAVGAAVPRRAGTTATFAATVEPPLAGAQRVEDATVLGDDGALTVESGGARQLLRNTAAGVEVSWVFDASPPVGSTDVVVRVRVDGARFVGATAQGLHFAGGTGPGLRFGHATWVDARGARTLVAARWVDGAIAMAVPARVARDSAYPAILDPLISSEMDLDVTSAPPAHAASAPAVDFDGTNYFVAWRDERKGKTAPAIYAARVTKAGVVLDPAGIEVCSASCGTSPSVAFDGTNHLVVWGHPVEAKRVSTVGKVLEAAAIVVDPTADTSVPLVAFDGTRYLVAYKSGRGSLSGPWKYDVTGAFVATDGTADGKPFAIDKTRPQTLAIPAPADGSDRTFAIDYDGSGYLVAWGASDTADGYFAGYALRIDTTGRVLDAAPVALGCCINKLSIAHDATNDLIAWSNNPIRRSVGTRFSRSGKGVLDPKGVELGDGPFSVEIDSVAFDGTDYVAVWHNYDVNWMIRIKPDGTLRDAKPIEIERWKGPVMSRLTLAVGDRQILAVGAGSYSLSRVPTIHGIRIGADAKVLDSSPVWISRFATPQWVARVAFDGTNYLVAWADDRSPYGVESRIYATRVSPSGVVLDPAGIAVPVVMYTPGVEQRKIAVAANASGFLVAANTPNATVVRVDSKGKVLDERGVVIPSCYPVPLPPLRCVSSVWTVAAACDPKNCMVIWAGDGRQELRGARIRMRDGAVFEGAGSVINDERANGDPAIAFNGKQYLAVWSGRSDGAPKVYATRVEIDGKVLDPKAVMVARPLGVAVVPSVASDGRDFLVAFQGDLYGTVYAARVKQTGEVLDPAGFKVSADPLPTLAPRVSFDGVSYVVTWTEPFAARPGSPRAGRFRGHRARPRRFPPRPTERRSGRHRVGWYGALPGRLSTQRSCACARRLFRRAG